MAIDKDVYLNKINKAGFRPTTANQAVIVEVLVDLLDKVDDCFNKLEDIRELLTE